MQIKPAGTVKIALCIVALALFLAAAAPPGSAFAAGAVTVLEVEGTITAGQLNYIRRQVDMSVERGDQLLVIILNTPGGLVDATLEINQTFLNAKLPVAVFVAPSGAIAASAGAFIVLSADVAAMAPGTTIGAAHPVTISPEGTAPADDKTATFLAGHLRDLAGEKGRPPELAARFVTENLTLGSREALEEGLIEYIAMDLEELLTILDGTEVEKQGRVYRFATAGAVLRQGEMNTREKLQHWLSDPQIAFILLMLGIMGLYFGLSSPGTFVPEVIGGILLLMGIYGIGLFDTNTTGILLLILGIGLIIAEIFTAGFGILGIGGAVCLVAGAVLLPIEPLMAADWYRSFRLTAIGTVIAVTVLVLVVAQRVLRSRKRWTDGSNFFKPPPAGVAVSKIAPEGMIRARGELWKARSENGAPIKVGTEVEVVRADGLTLWVRPVKQK